MTQARAAQLSNPFRDLRRAVAASDVVRALERVGFTQKQIANAAGATDRSVRNWAATGAIRPAYDERIRELSEISLVLSDTLSARGVTQWLNARGGIEADVTVTRVAESEFLVLTAAATVARDASRLRLHIGHVAHLLG